VTLALLSHDEMLPPRAQRQAALSQWFTPPDLARRVVEWCGRPPLSWRVLEPSAGSGALVEAMLGWECSGSGIITPSQLTAVEIDPAYADHLRAVCAEDDEPARVECCDYLTRPAPAEPFDLVVMNPPYEGGADSLFVAKAMDESRRVVALVRSAFFYGAARHNRVWSRVESRDWRLVGVAHLRSRPSFSAGGEDSGSPLSDFMAIKLSRVACDDVAGTSVEWW
jgi:predicted RNA methylase